MVHAKYGLLNFIITNSIAKVQKSPKSEISEMSISIDIHLYHISVTSRCSYTYCNRSRCPRVHSGVSVAILLVLKLVAV